MTKEEYTERLLQTLYDAHHHLCMAHSDIHNMLNRMDYSTPDAFELVSFNLEINDIAARLHDRAKDLRNDPRIGI